MTALRRWLWRSIENPAVGLRPFDRNIPSSSHRPRGISFTTRALPTFVSPTLRLDLSEHETGYAMSALTALMGATSYAVDEDTTRGLRKGKKSVIASSIGVATSAVRNA